MCNEFLFQERKPVTKLEKTETRTIFDGLGLETLLPVSARSTVIISVLDARTYRSEAIVRFILIFTLIFNLVFILAFSRRRRSMI